MQIMVLVVFWFCFFALYSSLYNDKTHRPSIVAFFYSTKWFEWDAIFFIHKPFIFISFEFLEVFYPFPIWSTIKPKMWMNRVGQFGWAWPICVSLPVSLTFSTVFVKIINWANQLKYSCLTWINLQRTCYIICYFARSAKVC